MYCLKSSGQSFIRLLLILTLLFSSTQILFGFKQVHEFQRYDGWFNNLANPQWGTVGAHLQRIAPNRYLDGVYLLDEYLPSARMISDLIFKGPSGIPNSRNLTTMVVYFSQVIAYEIMHSTQISCPLEMHKIPVPKCDPVFDIGCGGDTEIPFIRARYDKETGHGFNSPREQVNERTSWIDASFLYSTQEPWVAVLRSWKNGTLAEGPMNGYPPLNGPHIPLNNPPPPQIHRLMNPERLFMLGDSRINENPGLLSIGLILYRWHNKLAERFQSENIHWTDEEVFQAARRWLIATLQKITFYDFLPVILANPDAIPPYKKYNPNTPPSVSHAFAAAAFRFLHTIVPPGMLFRKSNTGKCEFHEEIGGYPALRLCQNWWNAQDIVQEYSVDVIVLGMASQIAEDEDSIVVEDLRDFIFGPMYFTRLDVVATTIMRGRDSGLPSYNEIRHAFNLPPRNWSTINPTKFEENSEKYHELAKLYNYNIDRLDAYVGGIIECDGGHGPGETFKAIILDQFLRIRDGDRFWFENTQNGIFTLEEIQKIHSITLRDIIRETTSIADNDLQENVFYWLDGDPCAQPFQVNTSGLEPCVPFMRFDHFTGNEVTYIFSCIALGVFPLICAGIGILLIRRREKMGINITNSLKSTERHQDNGVRNGCKKNWMDSAKSRIQFPAIEWIAENYCRSVVVIVMETEIRVEKARGGVLRIMDLTDSNSINFIASDPGTTAHRPFVLIRISKHYDLVLRLQSDDHSADFLHALSTLICDSYKRLIVRYLSSGRILEIAETREQRQVKLDRFFREAYANTFDAPMLSDGTYQSETISNEVLQTTLTKAEFAEALGMRQTDLFVERMFHSMAKQNLNRVTFLEFLSIIKKFSKGTMCEKLEILFNMCDKHGKGCVEREEFCEFVKSLNVAVGVQIDENLQNEVIEEVLRKSGVERDTALLTYKDFLAVFNNVEEKRQAFGVHMRGAKIRINLNDSDSLNSFTISPENTKCNYFNWLSWLQSHMESYRQQIVCMFLFTAINILVFLARFWHYRYETEHQDLRRVMGVGIAITRGAAASLSFCMGIILLTVCRNVITMLRETPFCEYIPFDSAGAFHKIVGIVTGFWAAIHAVGHCVNFYHVGTQSKEGLQCLFRNAVFGSNFLPTISYWFYGTLTGVTGILLVAIMSIIYVFSVPAVVKRAYHAFKITHLLNILLYALTILHGLPKMLDSPKFMYYVAGPMVIFIIDRIIGMRRKYKKLQILNAAILPSDIMYVQFKRPSSFNFRSGQWVQISCPAFSCTFNELHAFSIASAPQDLTLEVYIKAVGPWTWNLRNEIIHAQSYLEPYPVVHLNGPYGSENQDWHHFEIAVLIGGGIGVTPYASILWDLVTQKSSGNFSSIKCKKVYFLWACSTHKNYEWFIDVLRNVEEEDIRNILEMHIFITQFFHKFDLRTTMLYICEKHFRIGNAGRSMFTRLKAANHFGRPNFDAFLKFVQNKHSNASDIGVFSCGPNSLNKEIRSSCTEANRLRNAPIFHHHYETF